ncbi:protein of unknown function [Burkholderia multivorans]
MMQVKPWRADVLSNTVCRCAGFRCVLARPGVSVVRKPSNLHQRESGPRNASRLLAARSWGPCGAPACSPHSMPCPARDASPSR